MKAENFRSSPGVNKVRDRCVDPVWCARLFGFWCVGRAHSACSTMLIGRPVKMCCCYPIFQSMNKHIYSYIFQSFSILVIRSISFGTHFSHQYLFIDTTHPEPHFQILFEATDSPHRLLILSPPLFQIPPIVFQNGYQSSVAVYTG